MPDEKKTFPRIVPDQCEREGPKATIVIDCASMEQAYDMKTREIALNYAKSEYGMGRSGFSNNGSVEWVNEHGDLLRGEAFQAAKTRIVRVSYPIQEGL